MKGAIFTLVDLWQVAFGIGANAQFTATKEQQAMGFNQTVTMGKTEVSSMPASGDTAHSGCPYSLDCTAE